jgi:hypothetical protein
MSVERYREHALDCLRLAADTEHPAYRAALLSMAQAWVRLADQAEKNSHLDLVYAPAPLLRFVH